MLWSKSTPGATAFFFIPGFFTSLNLLNATGVRQNGLQEKIVDTYHFEAGFKGVNNECSGAVKDRAHCVLFYPRIHYELKFIKCHWCHAKWVARENCGYHFEAVRATAPEPYLQ